MEPVRITSVKRPFDTQDLARGAVGVIATAGAMGLLEGTQIRQLDVPSFKQVLDRIAAAGIGAEIRAALSAPGGWVDASELEGLVRRLATALEESPSPPQEWRSLEDLFGTEGLVELLGVSPASVRRYRSGARPTPDRVAARLHFVATVVGDLAGAYNEIGIRRWFQRRRALLDGQAPAELLGGDWDPGDPGPRRVRELARSLGAAPAT